MKEKIEAYSVQTRLMPTALYSFVFFFFFDIPQFEILLIPHIKTRQKNRCSLTTDTIAKFTLLNSGGNQGRKETY